MQHVDLNTDSLAGWLKLLIDRIKPEETDAPLQHVQDALQSVASGDHSSRAAYGTETGAPAQTRLIAFYINQAWGSCDAPDPAAQDTAQRQLHLIRRLLLSRVGRPLPPVTEHPSAGDQTAAREVQPAAEPAPAATIDHHVGDLQAGSSQPPGLMPNIGSPAMADAIRLVYRQALGREAADSEVEIWRGHFRGGLAFHEFLLAVADGEEARMRKQGHMIDSQKSDGEFVMDLYRLIMGRGCNLQDIEAWDLQLRKGTTSRSTLVETFFQEAVKLDRAEATTALHDGLSCWIMGTPHTLTLAEWTRKARDKAALDAARKALRPATPFVITAEPGIRVSAIASLYRGGDFIEQFLDNITGQTCFDRHCELIIIDAASPENEGEVISRYLARHPSIRYERTTTTIGIYEAWNLGARMARGRYLTNTNLDDLRRADSLEIQAGALDALPFADVVYQDFYYSFDPRLTWEEVAAFGYKSSVPIATPANMLCFNSPHNAPMWRRSLHDEVGFFEGYYKSAGDYEFWLRCLAAGKVFYKINEPHVVYYQNPKGLSTRADTKGVLEARAITRKYTPLLIDKDFTRHFAEFAAQVPGAPASHGDCPDLTRYEIVQNGLRSAAVQYKTGGK